MHCGIVMISVCDHFDRCDYRVRDVGDPADGGDDVLRSSKSMVTKLLSVSTKFD